MPTVSIGPYDFVPRDRVENFHGNQLVYLLWEKHLMFASPITVPLPPPMPFAAVIAELLPALYGQHPDFGAIDWSTVEWELDGAAFTPDPDQTLAAQGIAHKSMLRFRTHGLNGLAGAAF
jgi:phenol hydroxylase P4 protein